MFYSNNMNRKGNMIMETIIDLVIAALIIVAFFSVNFKLEDNTLFDQKRTARELALTIDTLTSAPRPVELMVTEEKGQSVKINKEQCLVNVRSTEKELIPTSFDCGNNNFLIEE